MGEGVYLDWSVDTELPREYGATSGSAPAPTQRRPGLRAWRRPVDQAGWVGSGPQGTGRRGLSLPRTALGPPHSGRRLPLSSPLLLELDPSLLPSPPRTGAEKRGTFPGPRAHSLPTPHSRRARPGGRARRRRDFLLLRSSVLSPPGGSWGEGASGDLFRGVPPSLSAHLHPYSPSLSHSSLRCVQSLALRVGASAPALPLVSFLPDLRTEPL